MASPQKENGYVAIATELFEAFARTPLPSGERQVLDAIVRKTYGFNKKADPISYAQLCELTGLGRRAVIYSIQNLEAKRIVLVSRKRNAQKNEPNAYAINKDYDSWVVHNCAPSVKRKRTLAVSGSAQRSTTKRGSAQSRKKVVHNGAPTIDNIQKTLNTAAANAAAPFSSEETRKKWYEGDDEAFQLLAWFFDRKGTWKKFKNREQVTIAVQRHIRAARRIVKGGWEQEEIEKELKRFLATNDKLKEEWTLETLIKYLTK